VGVDLDDVITDDGMDPHTQAILDRFPTYTELSPSGKGIHIILKSTIFPVSCNRKKGIEVYWQGRFFAMTGHPVPEGER